MALADEVAESITELVAEEVTASDAIAVAEADGDIVLLEWPFVFQVDEQEEVDDAPLPDEPLPVADADAELPDALGPELLFWP